jgi:hypothetical protein
MKPLGKLDRYKEGTWESGSVAYVIGALIEVEEEQGGVNEEGWVKDDRRVALKALEFSGYREKREDLSLD